MEKKTFTPEAFAGRYRLERHIGEGFVGVVCLATDYKHGRQVVIKALKPHALSDSKEVASFKNEFQILKHCEHPNIIHAFDFYEGDGLIFYTMEHLEGQTLNHFVQGCGRPLSLDSKIMLLFHIASGLLCVHEKGFIHRDLKPANVFLQDEGPAKLLDFGFARPEETRFGLVADNEIVGTLEYLSPEQLTGSILDKRSDIYSFGVTAYELFTSEPPIRARSYHDLARKHRTGKVPSTRDKNSTVPAWIDELITTCLQKSPERRFDSVEEILEVILRGGKNFLHPPGPCPSKLI